MDGQPNASAVAALTAFTVLLTGCARTPAPPDQAKIKQVILKLNDNPDTYFVEPFVASSPATGQLSRQVLVLVPPKGGAGYKLVDSQGDIFDDYNDFLRNNNLPDQPGPASAPAKPD